MSSNRKSRYLAITEQVSKDSEYFRSLENVNVETQIELFNIYGSLNREQEGINAITDGEIVPFYSNVIYVTHVENTKTEECKNQKTPISYRIVSTSTTSRVRKGGKSEERGLCQMVNNEGRKTTFTEIGAMIFLAENIETILRELSYTDYLEKELEYGNEHLFKNFKLVLVMEDSTK